MSDDNEAAATSRRSSYAAPAEGEVLPPVHPVPQRQPVPPARTANRGWLLPALTGILGVALGAIISATITAAVIGAQQEAESEAAVVAEEEARSDFFEAAARKCGIYRDVEIADEGRPLIVDGAGEDFGTGDVDFSGLECIIDAVDTPESVKELMFQTRSLDGRQSGEWDDVSASWGYHPDDGLDIIFELDD